jgi:hypothetical protein
MAKKSAAKKVAKRGAIPPPSPLAMVICDAIHRDPGSGKPFLLGCFSTIYSQKFPAAHPMMCVYVEMTNGRGKIPCRLQMVDVDEVRKPVFEINEQIDSPDPRAVCQIFFLIPGAVIPDPGEYRIQLFAMDQFLMERRILAIDPTGEPHE